MPPGKGSQCGGAERTGETGRTRLGRRRAGLQGHEAPGGGARMRQAADGPTEVERPCWPQKKTRVLWAHADKLEHCKECEDKEETDQYVPGG